ncbi:hypothetical protein EXIGLDRAFT_249707 [Exidia glandulosa HHB12029]|uniref:Uncharacterized protein n=1 Tax=Exidia glandulosa HHB12029 TaxID=1314781 RepID=A0A165MGQ1_EXIGL|nr:hypothetical protein EXIGLDRAFT_249707 [Exidia glandulosa HHB12029]
MSPLCCNTRSTLTLECARTVNFQSSNVRDSIAGHTRQSSAESEHEAMLSRSTPLLQLFNESDTYNPLLVILHSFATIITAMIIDT